GTIKGGLGTQTRWWRGEREEEEGGGGRSSGGSTSGIQALAKRSATRVPAPGPALASALAPARAPAVAGERKVLHRRPSSTSSTAAGIGAR
ncbi:unnamed protein product, partial [Discosporangium mesarthrocarpum]